MPLFNQDGVIEKWFVTCTDIQEIKQAEESLQKAREERAVAKAVDAERRQLFDMLETLPMMICLLPPDYHVAFANRSFRQKFSESSGRCCYDYCFGRTKPCEFCESYKVLETGKSHHWEFNSLDGRMIETYDFPFTDINGSPIIFKVAIDVTESKKAEEKIKNLANIVESSNDAIITMSFDCIVTSWNKGAEQVFGYSAEEIIGKPLSILDPPKLAGETEELTELIKQGDQIYNYETLRLRKDGTTIYVSTTLSLVLDLFGESIAISIIARDITKTKRAEEELRESEERYRVVTEQTGQIVYDYDSSTGNCKWAGAVEEVTGYSLKEFQKLDKDFWIKNVFHADMNRMYENFQDMEQIQSRFKEELRFRRKDGTYIYTENTCVYFLDQNIQPYRAIGVLRDINDRKKAEKMLTSKLEELSRSNEELEQFVYV